MVRAAFMKIKLREHQEIVSIARNNAAFLTRSLVKNLLIFRSGEAKFSDMDGVDAPGP
jgi:hypothetical protein